MTNKKQRGGDSPVRDQFTEAEWDVIRRYNAALGAHRGKYITNPNSDSQAAIALGISPQTYAERKKKMNR